jgi:hypothetical protein
MFLVKCVLSILCRDFIRCVPLVATRDIECGEELFSNYFTEVVS